MNLTRRFQRVLQRNLTLEDALPTRMPVYVDSLAYLFGAGALMALVELIASGIVLAAFGPSWYHDEPVGRFFNALHFWGVQVFFAALALHIFTKFFMAAWRDGRWPTWAAGMLAFFVALFAGLTGYLAQTNFDSQWIAVQSKDAINAAGGGSIFNPMNLGQVLTLHVVVLPLVIVALVGVHLILIRRDGPVRPLTLRGEKAGEGAR
ncbi:MAG: cytochrome b N-terminal domain-containing protein [Deinococcales bacterium]|jgi:quinol-cytochrome oxidoreductase complex cytochrome b subunit